MSTTTGATRVNWKQVAVFIGLTFGLSWLLALVLWLTVGYASPPSMLALQLLMLIPAFSAILLGMFFFTSSPIYFRSNVGRPRWFFVYFLVYTLVYAAIAIGSILSPALTSTLGLIGLAATVLGLPVVILLRVISGRDAFARVGLSGGKARYWALFGAGFVLFYASQAGLNYLFGLGHSVDITPIAQQAMMPPEAFLVAAGVQSVLLAPFIAVLIAFGEEYGWRGYLQGELIRMGRVRGVLLVGVVWGLWHAPIIAMGHNYPGYPVAGVFLMTLYTIVLAYVLGYAVLKSGSVWLAAFLHALNNQVYSFLVGLVYAPNDPVFSFGAGIYGLALGVLVVALVLRDPLWRENGRNPVFKESR